MNMTTTEQKLT